MIDNRFILNELLGVGGSSKVYSAKCEDGNEYALKIIRKDKGYSDELSKRLVANEHITMSHIGEHPNIVNSLAYNTNGVAFLADGQHDIRYLVLERCKNGALSTIIRHTGALEENVAKFLFLQLCSAVQFIHDKNYAHMDIKLENILLDDFFNIKLADLGTAINVEESMGFTNKRRGTPFYMAPEVRNKESEDMIDATIADVYSLGVCMHLLLTGEFPCKDSFQNELSSMETEVSGEISLPESNKKVREHMSNLSDDAKELLEEMLEENPFFRLSIDEVLQHPWMKDFDYEGLQATVYEEMNSRVSFINGQDS